MAVKNTGWVVPQSAVSVNTGDHYWSNPTYVFTDDGNYSKCDEESSGASDTHYSYNYNFSAIPATAKIIGIDLIINRDAETPGTFSDYVIQLMSSSTVYEGSNQATYNDWSASDYDAVYGGSTDLMGWTDIEASNVLSSNFGLGIRVSSNVTVQRNAKLDYIRMKIYYEETGGNLLNLGAF